MAGTNRTKINNAINYYREMIVRLKRVDGKFRARQEARARARLRRAWKKQIEWLIENAEALPQFENIEESSVAFIEKKQFEREIRDFVDDLPFNDDVVAGVMVSAESSYIKGGRKTFKAI